MTLHKCEAIRKSFRADHGIKSTVPVLMPTINDTFKRASAIEWRITLSGDAEGPAVGACVAIAADCAVGPGLTSGTVVDYFAAK